jgi:hypothetical protein
VASTPSSLFAASRLKIELVRRRGRQVRSAGPPSKLTRGDEESRLIPIAAFIDLQADR